MYTEPITENQMNKSSGNAPTLISDGVLISGQIRAGKMVRIEGTFIGEISDTESVIIGESGKIEGNIRAGSILVFGTVEGNLTAPDIEVRSSASISGDLNTRQLVMQKGASFTGRLTMPAPDTGTSQGSGLY